ncbi:MAG: hypothetical protein KIT61_12870 [Pyrinomonadaceae bacterium]|nr:hypothetical protein [Blastocatellia bacterium]MCW5957470.1 hypothetical protein [Pyrinomonadaceae bacterium]
MISIASCTSVKIEEAAVAEDGAAGLRGEDAENVEPCSITKGSLEALPGKARLCPATLTHKDRVAPNAIYRSSIICTTLVDRLPVYVQPD